MEFAQALEKGIFLKRYKRFFADIDKNGETLVAHVPNTGSMKSCNKSGAECLFSVSNNPERKLKFTLEAIKAESGAWVGVNTSWPSILLKEAFEKKVFKHWQHFDHIQAEVKVNDQSRLDYVLWNSKEQELPHPLKKVNPDEIHHRQKLHFIEIKNTTLANGKVASFPDAVTERGQKHIQELVKLLVAGHSVEMLYVVQRGDVESFSPADDIDPEYGRLLRDAVNKGLKITPVMVKLSPEKFEITGEILKVVL
jgi:sugar fermentation stimulation protein A